MMMASRTVLVTLAVALLAALALLAAWRRRRERFEGEAGAAAAGSEAAAGEDHSRTNAGLKPQQFSSGGRIHMYQIPPNPKGTLAVFPGCSRTPAGFWPAGSCKQCLGFPEDVAQTKQALRKGYAVIVLSPKDEKVSCWSSKVDFPDAGAALEKFLGTNGLSGKPVYTAGSSSGGSIALNMQAHVEAARLSFQVRGVIDTVSTRQGPRPVKKQPAVVWVVMSDPAEKKRAEDFAKALKGAPGTAVVVSGKKKVTPSFFSDRMPVITPAESAQMVTELVKAGVVDGSGTLVKDPKRDRTWAAKLQKAMPAVFNRPGASLSFNKSGIWQAMLNAYSKHEHTSEYTTAALEWFESGAKTNFAQMAEKYRVAVPAALTI